AAHTACGRYHPNDGGSIPGITHHPDKHCDPIESTNIRPNCGLRPHGVPVGARFPNILSTWLGSITLPQPLFPLPDPNSRFHPDCQPCRLRSVFPRLTI